MSSGDSLFTRIKSLEERVNVLENENSDLRTTIRDLGDAIGMVEEEADEEEEEIEEENDDPNSEEDFFVIVSRNNPKYKGLSTYFIGNKKLTGKLWGNKNKAIKYEDVTDANHQASKLRAPSKGHMKPEVVLLSHCDF